MTRSTCVLPLLSLFLLSQLPLAAQDSDEQGSFYTVAEYGIDRDPAADLKATVERAQAGGKRILIQVGGEWCGWCKLLEEDVLDEWMPE